MNTFWIILSFVDYWSQLWVIISDYWAFDNYFEEKKIFVPSVMSWKIVIMNVLWHKRNIGRSNRKYLACVITDRQEVGRRCRLCWEITKLSGFVCIFYVDSTVVSIFVEILALYWPSTTIHQTSFFVSNFNFSTFLVCHPEISTVVRLSSFHL